MAYQILLSALYFIAEPIKNYTPIFGTINIHLKKEKKCLPM
jgi:hypothetical protein